MFCTRSLRASNIVSERYLVWPRSFSGLRVSEKYRPALSIEKKKEKKREKRSFAALEVLNLLISDGDGTRTRTISLYSLT